MATNVIDGALVEALLAAEQVQPERCAPDVWERGEAVVMLAGPRAWMIERWVREVAARTGLAVDWSSAGGRAVVQAVLPDHVARSVVRVVVDALLPSLRVAAEQAKLRGDVGAYELQSAWWARFAAR